MTTTQEHRKTSVKFLARVFIEYSDKDSEVTETNVWVHELYPDELAYKRSSEDWVRESLQDLLQVGELVGLANIIEYGHYEVLFGGTISGYWSLDTPNGPSEYDEELYFDDGIQFRKCTIVEE